MTDRFYTFRAGEAIQKMIADELEAAYRAESDFAPSISGAIRRLIKRGAKAREEVGKKK